MPCSNAAWPGFTMQPGQAGVYREHPAPVVEAVGVLVARIGETQSAYMSDKLASLFGRPEPADRVIVTTDRMALFFEAEAVRLNAEAVAIECGRDRRRVKREGRKARERFMREARDE